MPLEDPVLHGLVVCLSCDPCTGVPLPPQAQLVMSDLEGGWILASQ